MESHNQKVALVTGGAGGIGSATASRLAENGSIVYVVDIDGDAAAGVSKSIVESGGTAFPIQLDITSKSDVIEAVRRIEENHDAIDILVNNAGIIKRGKLLDVSDSDWKSSFAVNVDAIFTFCSAVLPAMIRSGGGSIVNVASQWGLEPAPGYISYNVTKAAVVSFTKSLARDYAFQGIRVNAVCPGEIHTQMLEQGLRSKGKTILDVSRNIPVGRVGEPSEVASLITFLASDEAKFICGACVEITGAQLVS